MLTRLNKKNKVRQEAALAYASRGWVVFPCHGVVDGRCTCIKKGNCTEAGKHPRTANGLNDGTTDVKEIARWWTKMPQANIAVVTGKTSGFWVLDADGAEGIKAVTDLENKHGKLPRTPIARTGGGGRHYFFVWPEGPAIKNCTKLCGLPVDVRGNRGYVIVPPSTHKSGNDYEWQVSPDDAELAQAPAWLLEMVRSKKMPATVTTTSTTCTTTPALSTGKLVLRIQADLDLATHDGVPEGERHDKALALIGAHLSRGDEPAKIMEQALAWGSRCQPPMPADEIRRIVKDLTEKEKQQTQAPESWEPPTRFDDFDLPSFPTDALPGWLRDFAEAEAVATQTPVELPAMLSLACVGACCAKKVEVRVNEGYREPVNLFVAVAMRPGNRKSAVFTDVTDPLREYEQSESQRMLPEIAKAKNEAKIATTRLGQLQKDAAESGEPDEQTALMMRANELAVQVEETAVPKTPRLITADATPEALASLLADNGGRMAVMCPEGDVFDLMSGRYSRGSSNFGIYLQGHAGDDVRVDRQNRPTEFVKRPALTVALAVQPHVILGLGEKQELRGRGLLARFLYALPKSLMGRRDVVPPVMPQPCRATYQNNMTSLLKLTPATDSEGVSVPHAISLGPQAEVVRIQFATWLEPMLDDNGELGSIQDWASKLAGGVSRIAGLMHMAEHVADSEPWKTPISETTMEQAVRIGRYLIGHARAAFSLMGADPVVEDAKHVLAWIERKEQNVLTEREIFEGTKGRFKKVDQLRPALTLLVVHNYLKLRQSDPRPGPGRRPSPVYEVNPRASEYPQNSQYSQDSPPVPKTANYANDVEPEKVVELSAPVSTGVIGKLRIVAEDDDNSTAESTAAGGGNGVTNAAGSITAAAPQPATVINDDSNVAISVIKDEASALDDVPSEEPVAIKDDDGEEEARYAAVFEEIASLSLDDNDEEEGSL